MERFQGDFRAGAATNSRNRRIALRMAIEKGVVGFHISINKKPRCGILTLRQWIDLWNFVFWANRIRIKIHCRCWRSACKSGVRTCPDEQLVYTYRQGRMPNPCLLQGSPPPGKRLNRAIRKKVKRKWGKGMVMMARKDLQLCQSADYIRCAAIIYIRGPQGIRKWGAMTRIESESTVTTRRDPESYFDFGTISYRCHKCLTGTNFALLSFIPFSGLGLDSA